MDKSQINSILVESNSLKRRRRRIPKTEISTIPKSYTQNQQQKQQRNQHNSSFSVINYVISKQQKQHNKSQRSLLTLISASIYYLLFIISIILLLNFQAPTATEAFHLSFGQRLSKYNCQFFEK